MYLIKILLSADKTKAITICVLSLSSGLIPSISAIVNANTIDEISRLLSNESFECGELAILIFIRLVLSIFAICMANLRELLIAISGMKVINCIRTMICDKAKEVDISDYDSPDYYSKLENAMQEVGIRPVSVLTSACTMISGIVTIVSYVVILCTFSRGVAIWSVIFAIPEVYAAVVFRRKVFEYNVKSTVGRRKISLYSKHPVNQRYVKEIKAYGLFSWFKQRYQEEYQKHFKGLRKLAIGEFTWETLANVFYEVAHIFLYAYVLKLTILTRGSIGSFVLYVGALSSMVSHIKNICGNAVSIYSSSLFIDNLIQFINRQPTINTEGVYVEMPSVLESIEFKNVSFSYPGSQRKIIERASFSLTEGDVVFIDGENGTGKTTIFKLLLRFYDPDKGCILLNGIDIRRFEADEYRKRVSALFQDFEKYPETVSQNIWFGNIQEYFDEQRYEKAIETAGAKTFIEKLTLGSKTPLTKLFSDDGIELSRGQWQKLSLARALYKEAFLELYDEPTASMDECSTEMVMKKLKKKEEGKIKIIISHDKKFYGPGNKRMTLDGGRVILENL